MQVLHPPVDMAGADNSRCQCGYHGCLTFPSLVVTCTQQQEVSSLILMVLQGRCAMLQARNLYAGCAQAVHASLVGHVGICAYQSCLLAAASASVQFVGTGLFLGMQVACIWRVNAAATRAIVVLAVYALPRQQGKCSAALHSAGCMSAQLSFVHYPHVDVPWNTGSHINQVSMFLWCAWV